jgi:two-component system, response regulator RegA
LAAEEHRGGGDTPSLLLVDDDHVLSETLARALTNRGFDVRTALNAEDATRSANENPPEYAIVDLRLPDRSGLELVSTLISLDPHTRIVVLTGYGSIATAVEAIKLGATYYLTKPVNADDLVSAFQRETGDEEMAPNSRPMSVDRLEWEYIDRVLQEHKGNISATARALSMHRRTLQRKLAKHPVRN